MDVKLTALENSTFTVRRSSASWDRSRRIFSARCGGVYERGATSAVAVAAAGCSVARLSPGADAPLAASGISRNACASAFVPSIARTARDLSIVDCQSPAETALSASSNSESMRRWTRSLITMRRRRGLTRKNPVGRAGKICPFTYRLFTYRRFFGFPRIRHRPSSPNVLVLPLR